MNWANTTARQIALEFSATYIRSLTIRTMAEHSSPSEFWLAKGIPYPILGYRQGVYCEKLKKNDLIVMPPHCISHHAENTISNTCHKISRVLTWNQIKFIYHYGTVDVGQNNNLQIAWSRQTYQYLHTTWGEGCRWRYWSTYSSVCMWNENMILSGVWHLSLEQQFWTQI